MSAKADQELRVAVVGVRWPPETFLARLMRGLAEAGVEVTIACASDLGVDWRSQPRVRRLAVRAWQGPRPLRLLRLGLDLAAAWLRSPADARRLLAATRRMAAGSARCALLARVLPFAGRRWDVVYFPWNGGPLLYAPLLELAPPAVVSCRGSQIHVVPHDPRRVGFSDALHASFERVAAVHCVSQAIREEAGRYGLNPGKAAIIRPAVDPGFFRPAPRAGRPDGALQVLSIGNLVWQKGYEYALAAVRRLVDEGIPVRYEVLGDGPERGRVLYTLCDLEIGDHVRLLGRRPPAEVRDRLCQADVLLLSSVSEGISNAVLEAMACGLPVVTTDCGGMREAVTDGVEGFVTPVRDPQAVAAALRRLWEDGELRERMGRAARRRVEADFSLGDQIEGFRRLFADVAAARP